MNDNQNQKNSSFEPNMIENRHQFGFNDYKTLITNYECIDNVVKGLDQMEVIVDDVINCLPKLVDKCHTFERDAQNICFRWRDVSIMLAKHPQLLQVMEIPQLMDTCVRNGFYDESLHIYSYIQKLSKTFGDSVPIISVLIGCYVK